MHVSVYCTQLPPRSVPSWALEAAPPRSPELNTSPGAFHHTMQATMMVGSGVVDLEGFEIAWHADATFVGQMAPLTAA